MQVKGINNRFLVVLKSKKESRLRTSSKEAAKNCQKNSCDYRGAHLAGFWSLTSSGFILPDCSSSMR